jgi:hypothetical protein
LNNLQADPSDARGAAYDASGKVKAAATLTSAAQASWSSKPPRRKGESKHEYDDRRSKDLEKNPPMEKLPARSVSLAPEGRQEDGNAATGRRGRLRFLARSRR